MDMRDWEYLLWVASGFLSVAALFSSCASVSQKLDPGTFYKRDMIITVNGFKSEGVIVVPQSESYSLDIKAKGNLDLFTMESCHREESVEDAGEGGIFGDGHRVKRTYKPVAGIETGSSCPVRLGGYERTRGRNSWALIDFEGPDTNLPAVMKCNGNVWNSRGVTVCQSKAGLIEQIEFPTKVIVNPDPNCPIKRPADLMTYRFTMSPRECVFNFMEIAIPHREHRLTTLGYQEILLRNN